MGFKENINQTLWGNPNDAVWLESESWGLYAPYKKGWFGGNTTMPHYNIYNSYKGLMYAKDIPPTIDESICPWGINAKSGIGNRYLMSGYKLGSEYIPVVVPTAVNTSKGQKPVYFAFSDPKAAYTNTLQLPYYDTTGYLESQKSNFSETYPSKVLGYSFISNINLKRIFVLPIIIAADSTKSVINISTGYDTKKPFYAKYPYQPQFTVYEYFNGTTSDGIQYTEKYPYILGVYAGIFYKSKSGTIIPNINLLVQSESSEEFLTKYPVLDVDDTRYMSWSDYVKYTGTGNYATTPYGEPTYLTVIGHNKLEFASWTASTGGVLEIQDFTSEEEAVSNAFYGSSEYISYIIPKELDSKLKTGVAVHNSSYTRCGVAWYEGLTEDDIYRQISYVGLPFYAGEDDISTVINSLSDKDFTSNDFRHSLMYPDFSANMVTTGTYSPYTSSASPLKDTEWLFDIEENYDPEITFPWAVSFTTIGENDDGSQSNLKNAVFILQYNGDSRFNGVESSPELNINISEKTVTWTSTGADTVVLGLPQGDYTLIENVTPEGYVQAQNITFSVTADGKVVDAVNTFGEVIDNNIRIYNKKARRKTVFQYEYITIYDSKTKQNQFNTHGLGVLTPTLCTITENYNGKWELSITHPFDSDNKYQYIREHNIIKALGQLFTIKVVTYSSGDKNEVSAKAEHIFYQQNDWWISPNAPKIIFTPNYSVQSLLDYIDAISEKLIVEGQTYYNYSRYSDMIIPADYPLRTLPNSEGISPVGVIMDSGGVLEVTKGELYRDNFYFSVKERMENSNDNAFEIRIGTNLKGIKRTVDFTTVCTYFSGFDDYGAMFAVSWNDASVNLVGMPHSVKRSKKFSYTFDDPDMTEQEKIDKSFELLCADTMTFFETNCKPLISYEVDIEDVQNNPDFVEFNNKPDYRVGNIGIVYDERLGEKVRLKITKTIKDAITGKTKTVIFGDNRSFTGNNGYNSAVVDMTPIVKQRSFQLLDSSGALVFDADYNAIIQEVKNG